MAAGSYIIKSKNEIVKICFVYLANTIDINLQSQYFNIYRPIYNVYVYTCFDACIYILQGQLPVK